MKKKSKGGRKTVMTEKVLAKLQEAFLMGCTDTEACLFAEIDPASLYRYQEDHPDYASKKAQWKEHPFIIARKSITEGMVEDPKLALAYMERKKKDEFGLKAELDVTSDGEKLAGFVLLRKEVKDGEQPETNLPGSKTNSQTN